MNQVKPNVEDPSKGNAGHTLIGAAKFLALVSAPSAVFGPLTAAYYHYGQLNAFNLSESIFPVQLSDTLTLLHRALLSIVGNAIIPMLYAPTLMEYALLTALMAGVVIFIGVNLRKRKAAGKSEWFKHHLDRPILLSLFGGAVTGASFYIIPWIFFLGCSFVILIPMVGYYAGRHDAQAFLAQWKECGKAEVGLRQRCTTVKALEEQAGGQKTTASYTGEIVVGNDKWLGIVTDTEILTLPASLQSIRVGRIPK